MHLFSENKKRNDFGNSLFLCVCVCVWGGGKERGKIADTMNIETASAIFYCRFGYYYNWSTSSIFKE